jgi:hypothetical protein
MFRPLVLPLVGVTTPLTQSLVSSVSHLQLRNKTRNIISISLVHISAWFTPVVENKRENVTNRSKGYLSSRVSWPSLVTVPLMVDAASFVLLYRTTAN